MGQDKATLLIDGQSMASRIAKVAEAECCRVTILGQEPISGYGFLEDEELHGGPLAALARFEPQSDFVFVAACDLPLFSPGVISAMRAAWDGRSDVVMPVLSGQAQPLCALYRRLCWPVDSDSKRVMNWAFQFTVQRLSESELRQISIEPWRLQSANTPAELQGLLRLGEQ